jgi:pyruvate dehydrogenase E2 component (dihydrolipoamide acetyltransferase)
VSQTIDVQVPDIGDFKDVPVIEIMVKAGDSVKKNDSLITLESEKASMEIPSTAEGKVAEVKVKVGDKVSMGSPIVTLTSDAVAADQTASAASPPPVAAPSAPSPTEATSSTIELRVPDIGDFSDVPVVDVLVKPGDRIEKEASLIVLESEKASMEVPAVATGTVQDVRVKAGDKVSKGTVIATLATGEQPVQKPAAPAPAPAAAQPPPAPSAPPPQPAATIVPSAGNGAPRSDGMVHASPSIRRFARELGVDLATVRGSGPSGRVTREDVQSYVKVALQKSPAPSAGVFADLPAWPKVDFAHYGEIERAPLSRIKKLSGPNLHRNWLQIPHITNYDEADVTDLEEFRQEVNAERAKRSGTKLTMLAFLMKASVATLREFPDFNSSLDGDSLIRKKYYNIGFAADTPNGLVVPVIKNAERKSLFDIAEETSALAAKAREGKLGLADMQGGSFTISSIGGIGGTAFTQIVNAPEVAILGATRAEIRPVWTGKKFKPRLILPISVSYDHRVIDGAAAARFLVYFAGLLRDFRRVTL